MKLKSVVVAALAAAFVFVGCDKNELTDPNKGDGTEQTDPNNPSDPSNPDGTDPEDPNNPGGENPGENPGGENPENPTLPGAEISLFDFAQLPNSDQTLYRISGHVWTVDVDDDQTLVILANCLYDEDNFDPTKHAVVRILNPTWLNNLNPALRPGHVLTVAGSKGTFGEDPDGDAIILNSQYVSHVDYSEPYLVFDMYVKPYLGSEAGEYTFNVYSNTDWTVTAPEGTTVTPASGNGCAELTFTYPANAKLEDMFYPLAFSYSGKTVELKFQQQALRYSLELSQYHVEVAADSTVASVDVLSNGAWTVIAPEGVTATPASGEGNATVNFTFAENKTRDQINYNVKITGGDVICDFIISQAPYEGLLALTVAEFLDAAVSTEYYQLTGIMSGTYNTTYGNFYLEDETGKVLVYGLTATQQTSNDKSFASLGLRDGDTLTLIGQRADYNGTAQVGGPAYYVSHVAAPFVDFTASNASVDAEATTYTIEVQSNTNWTATPSAGVTLDKTSGNGNASVVMTFAANTTSEAISHSVVFTAEGSTATFELLHKGVPAATGGGRADLETLSTNTSYVSSTTTDGWKGANCAIVQGGTSDSSPTFKCIGKVGNTSTYAKALCMNGKTSAVGTITSPTLKGGCGTLSFDYTLVFSDNKVKFRVDILQGGSVVKTFTVDHSSFTKFDVKKATYDVNVAGDFTVKFTNLSPSSSTSNKDRTAVWNIEWTGYSN